MGKRIKDFCRNIMLLKTLAMQLKKLLIPAVAFVVALSFKPFKEWQSKFVHVNQNGSLEYFPDEKGDVLPDFSRVGYYGGDRAIPDVPVVKTIEPAASG